MGELPQEETLLVESADEVASIPARWSKVHRIAVVCGCAALVLAGYALGSRRSSLVSEEAVISEVGAILTEADFKTLYASVTASLTDAQLAAINGQITGTGAAITNANVQLLRTWYNSGTNSNKIFANKLIAASMTTSRAPASTGTDTVSARCPITTYAQFGSLYSRETSGKTWAQINKIDSWVRLSTTAVGAPLSVRKLRDCYKNTLSTANRKDFDTNAVAHMKAGAAR